MNSLESWGVNLSTKALVNKGDTANVYRVETPDGPAALKMALPNTIGTRLVAREAEIMAELNHPNIIRLRASGVRNRPSGKIPWILMDYADSSINVDSRHSPTQTVQIIGEAATALDYLHTEAEVVHGDITPGNLLVRKNEIVIADFGTARRLAGKRSAAQADAPPVDLLTYAYTPPEVWDGYPKEERGDVYALAIITEEMLTGKSLFDENGRAGYEYAHTHQVLPPLKKLLEDDLTDEHAALEEVIRWGLEKDPMDRPTAKEYKKALVDSLS